MKTYVSVVAITLSLMSHFALAANIPSDSLGAEKYDSMKCVDEMAQNCINNQCLTSDQIDCQSNCKTLAQQKCQQQNN